MSVPSVEYLAAIEKGRILTKNLEQFRDDEPTTKVLQESYHLEENDLRGNPPDQVVQVLANYGINFGGVRYVSAVPKPIKKSEPIFMNWFSAHDGVVLANLNDKRGDVTPEDEKMFPSEIFWQSWCRVAERESVPVSNLRVIIRCFIINPVSRTVIRDALKFSSTTRVEQKHLEFTDLDDGFFALLGTPNGASSMRTLQDHRQALGFRTIERVVLLREDPEKPPTFLILLSSPREDERTDKAPFQ